MAASREAQFRKIFVGVFVVVGLVIAMWQANTVWSISHECQCGLAYGFSSGDFTGAQLPRTALIFVPFIIALFFHPLAGLIADFLEFIYLVFLQVSITGTLRQGDSPYFQFLRSSNWAFFILNGVGLAVSIYLTMKWLNINNRRKPQK